MGGFGGAVGSANFQEPSSPDQTSAPAMPDQGQQGMSPNAQKIAGGLAAALAKRKKGIGPTSRAPAALASAISRARRARQGGDKYG
jgi:hypothetical protein